MSESTRSRPDRHHTCLPDAPCGTPSSIFLGHKIIFPETQQQTSLSLTYYGGWRSFLQVWYHKTNICWHVQQVALIYGIKDYSGSSFFFFSAPPQRYRPLLFAVDNCTTTVVLFFFFLTIITFIPWKFPALRRSRTSGVTHYLPIP